MGLKNTSKEKTFAKEEELLLYKYLVESADSAIIARDLNGIITSWNKAAEELFGYKAHEAIGQHFSIIVPKDNFNEITNISKLINRGLQIEDYETIRVKKNGQKIHVIARIYPLLDHDGNVIGTTAFDRDNTEKKKQRDREKYLLKAQTILSSTLKYNLALKKLAKLFVPELADWSAIHMVNDNGEPQQITVAHTDPKMVKWAEELQEKVRHEPKDPNNATYRVIKTGKSELYPLITQELIRATVKKEEDMKLIEKLELKSVMMVPLVSGKKVLGSITLVSTDENRLYDKSDLQFAEEIGRLAGQTVENARLYLDAQTEIKKRKKIEDRLRASEVRLRTIFSTVADGITVFDENARVVFVNKAVAESSGYLTPQKMLKSPLRWIKQLKVVDENDRPISIKELPGRKAALTGQNAEKIVKSINLKTGEERWAIVKASPMVDNDGAVRGSVSITHDITLAKELERRKDDFIGIASHELKTPITSIKGFVHLLKKEHREYERSYNFLDRIDKQLNNLTELVQDLLDITKIKSGKLAYKTEKFDISELVQEVISDLQLTTETHKIFLKNGIKSFVNGDKDRISQVLINLINNAIKYSPDADRVDVDLSSIRSGVRIDVKDYGIGISQEEMDKIFDRFYRVKDTKGRTFPGLGIGLYLSREIAQRHKGKIWADSQKGNGSTFHLSLPAKK